MAKKKILAYSIYYYPEVASVAQIYTELFESIADEFDITVICAVPCYTGKVPDEYKDRRFYEETYNGVRVLRVPVTEYSKQSKLQRIINIISFWFGARKATKKSRRLLRLGVHVLSTAYLGWHVGRLRVEEIACTAYIRHSGLQS